MANITRSRPTHNWQPETLHLLPYPRSLKRHSGFYTLPARAVVHLDAALHRDITLLPLAGRLKSAAERIGVQLELVTGSPAHPRLAIRALQSTSAPAHAEGYSLLIGPNGIRIHYRQE